MSFVLDHQPAVRQVEWSAEETLKDRWRDACDDLSVTLTGDAAETVAHEVSISLIGAGDRVRTQYSVRIDALSSPQFTLTRRVPSSTSEKIGTNDSRFEEAVEAKTNDQSALVRYLNPERRSMILQLVSRMPDAVITNESVSASSKGAGKDSIKVSGAISRLIEVAEAMRPSWAEVALDERSVLHDLFNSDRDVDGVTRRFEELYAGNTVNWIGEVLQVGAVDHAGRRAAVLIGTADGKTAESGRVVALTALDPDVEVVAGDVVRVSGSMWNLDPKKRFFRIE